MTVGDPGYYFRKHGLESRYKKRIADAKRGVASAAIVLKCVECCGMEYQEAKNCRDTQCPLYPLNERHIKRPSLQKQAKRREP